MKQLSSEVTVFVVDDDADDVYLVRQILLADTNTQFNVSHFYSIAELEASLANSHCDVILLDLGLGESQGLETLKRVAECAADIPIIILTGFDEDEFGETAIKLGAQDYIPKAELKGSLLKRVIKFALERHKLVSELKHLSQQDPLTSLSNKTAFERCLQSSYDAWKRYNHAFSVMFIDLDEFKPINDTLGHTVGDQVLKIVGQRLVSFGRTTDCIARVGGDEFSIILPHLTDKAALESTALNKLKLLQQPILVKVESGVKEVLIGASVGIAISDSSCDAATKILENADSAMYVAKSKGGNKVAFYTP